MHDNGSKLSKVDFSGRRAEILRSDRILAVAVFLILFFECHPLNAAKCCHGPLVLLHCLVHLSPISVYLPRDW